MNSGPLDRLFPFLDLSGFGKDLLSLVVLQPVRLLIIFGYNEFTPLFVPKCLYIFLANFALLASLLKRTFKILLDLNKPSLKIANFILQLIIGSVRFSKRTVRHD